MRAKIVLLASQGLGNDRIAAELGLPRQIASKWRQRFCIQRLPGLDDRPRGGRPARFSPNVVVAIKALACELPSRRGLPLARWSVAELRREAMASGMVAQISGTRSGVGLAVLKLMYAALVRAAERWRGIRISEFEQRQLNAIRTELDRTHAERTAPAVTANVIASPTHLSGKQRN
jgi:hypothetical protein